MFHARRALRTMEDYRLAAATRAVLLAYGVAFSGHLQACSQFVVTPIINKLHANMSPETNTDPLAQPPRQWAVEAAGNEIKAIQYDSAYLRYRVHSLNGKGDQLRDVVESKDGTVARLIAKDNRALTAEEDAAEHDRLQGMLNSPSAFAKRATRTIFIALR